MTNHRLTIIAAIAVLAAALSLYSLLQGNAWMAASIGAVAAVAGAGTLTRLATIPAATAATVAVLIALVWPLSSSGWLGLGAALVVVGLAAASATGSRLPRAFAALATYVAVLVFYLNLVFASSKSLARIIPTGASLAALSRMPSQASSLFRFSPPIQPNRAVEFFAAAGIGVVAILVDLLAVRLRRPAIAGLPLLLLFSVPVASTLKGFGLYQTITFGVGIAAYLALLSADGRQRLRMWGRLVSIRRISVVDENSAAPDTREVAASGRRVGLAAVALAMAVPVVLVGSSPHDLFKRNLDGGGLPSGGSGGSAVSPLLSISGQLAETNATVVLTYSTTNRNPTEQYFQEYVLSYSARSNQWLIAPDTLTPVTHPALRDPVPGLAASTPVKVQRTTIDIAHYPANTALPLPYAPTKISASVHLSLIEGRGSLMVWGRVSQAALHYVVTSTEADPSKADLTSEIAIPTPIAQAYGSYNGPDKSRLTVIAERHISGATTELQMADDLQNWFDSSQFAYTVRPTLPDSPHWLVDFLTSHKRGDCEQFAPAFAVLARVLGIPSRVVVGYTGGTENSSLQWQVTTADAHAWPELYFPNVGWVRFEPTPTAPGGNGQGTASLPAYSVGKAPGLPGGAGPTPSTSAGAGGSGRTGTPGGTRLRNPGGGAGGTGSAAGAGSRLPVGLVVAIAVLLLIVWPAAGRWLTSRRRWLTASGDAALAHAAWLEFADYLSDYGLAGPPSESPRATSARVALLVGSPAAAAALTRIRAAEERARYAVAPTRGAGLRGDVSAIRKAMAATCTWRQRMRARVLPASTLAQARSGLQSANRALSWIDSPLPSLRHRTSARAASRA